MRAFIDAALLTIGSLVAVVVGILVVLALVARARLRDYRRQR